MRKTIYALLLTLLSTSLILTLCLSSHAEEDCDCDKDLHEILRELEEKELQKKSQLKLYPKKNNTDIIAIFSYNNCTYCQELRNKLIPSLEKKHNKRVDTRFMAIDTSENYEKLLYILKDKNLQKKTLPVIVGQSFSLFGQKEINNKLEDLIKDDNNFITLTTPSHKAAKKDIINNFKKFTPALVLSAGLIDGINPCAFSVIIFLISYLSFLGINRRKILYSGISFSVGVFAFYFLIGIGIFDLIKLTTGSFSYISNWARIAFSIIVAILLTTSIYDIAILLKGNKPTKMILKLPNSYQKNIHKYIHIFTKKKYTVAFSFILGIAISSIELACTGQIYFPTIAYLIKEKTFLTQSIYYLSLYNLAFILPLIVVFVLVFIGISTKRIEKFFKANLILSKVLISSFFAILLFYLII